ncbi:MAG: hypothetical protein VX670_12290, partial [Candidatus Latescibacterota bacterium]|nr:hypothetical protein [Candidatus Latescibacterota bacterium]
DEKTVDFNKRHSEMISKLVSKGKFFLFLHYTEMHKNLVNAVIQKYDQESNDDKYFQNLQESVENISLPFFKYGSLKSPGLGDLAAESRNSHYAPPLTSRAPGSFDHLKTPSLFGEKRNKKSFGGARVFRDRLRAVSPLTKRCWSMARH